MFPQFAARGPLPKHGIARDRRWDLDTGSEGAPVARIAAELRDDERTRAIWPHRFCLSLLAEAVGDTLTMTVQVRNEAPEGGEPFSLTAALHTYLAVDTTTARLSGLAGHDAEDHMAGGAVIRLPDEPLPAPGPLDVAFRGARGPVRVVDGRGSELEVTCEGSNGFDSLVVWNPGSDHELTDVPPGGAEQFVCVEPARLDPVTVEPQGTWRAAARLTALVPNSR